MSDRHWSYEELGTAELGDARRTRRLVKVAKTLSKKVGHTMGAAMDMAGAKAAYRLFNEPSVTPEAILAPHTQQTLLRMKAEPVVLVAQDTTVLNFSSHEEAEGFGGIGGGYATNHGCFLHSALAFNEAGVPLGILSAKQWARPQKSKITPNKKSKAKKESARWGETVESISALPLPQTKVVHLADQEGDDWSLLSACVEQNASYVIRADGLRGVKPGISLRDTMLAAEVMGYNIVPVSAKKLRKGHGAGAWSPGNDRPAAEAREAKVEVRVKVVTMPKTRTRTDGQKSITMTVVSAIEVAPPKGIKDPLEWHLMTDQPVTSLAEAERIIAWYRQRWAIETWHRTLKSGIKVEDCRLSTYDRMQRYISLAAILAWRIDWMVKVAREQPETPVEALLDPMEIEILKRSSRNRSKQLLTIRDGIRQIAMLGGFTGLKSAGEPGSLTLWRGWTELMAKVDVLQTFLPKLKVKDVGSR